MNTHHILNSVVARARCLPGWSFRTTIDDNENAVLVIRVSGHNSATPDDLKQYTIDHYFPLPMACYNEASWRRWVFEMCRRVMNHEIGEWLRFGDTRPFLPLHGPGEDPYTVHEYRPVADALTTQDGSMREP